MKILALFLVILAMGGSLFAQNPPGAYGPGTGSSSSSSSPSSLTTFFNKFYGLSPQDYGAKGDTHLFFDCGMTTNNHLTCGSSHFTSADVGKWFESCSSNCNTATINVNQGTITAFNSATDVTVSVTAGTTYANTRTAYGTDDDAAMQSWATAIIQSPVNGVPPLTRGGYLPQGGYAIKQPIQLKYPGCATQGVCTQGEGGPNSGSTATLRPSLWIVGQGTASSFIYVRTAGVFIWPTQSTNVAAFYVKDFDFSSLSNFGIIADLSAHNTAFISSPGGVAGLMNDNSTHALWTSMWVQGFHNTTNTMCAFMNSGNDFESTYTWSAFEASDINGCIGKQGTAAAMEKVAFVNDFFENPLVGQNIHVGTANSNTLSLKQISFINTHSLGGNIASINFLTFATTPLGESVQLYNFRASGVAGSSGLGIVTNATAGLSIDCHGCYLEDASASAGNVIVDNTSAAATINFYGGQFYGAGLTNLFNNTGNIFIYGTKIAGGPSVSAIQTGSGNTYSYIPVAGASGGWSGRGIVQSTSFIANQGTLPIIANFVLSAGWGTTAAVTGVSGGTQGLRFTVTASGTGQAANPTITWTLPAGAALPSSTVNCHLDQTGGTGAFTMITQTTQSATVPVFTLQGTPTAAATYIYEGGCGR